MGLRSSVDRALVSGTKGRRFESCRGHNYDWVVLLRPSFLRFTTPKVGALDWFPVSTINHMPRKPGYLEWDDENLTPGRGKEGGWSPNLFDSDGNLKGHARFIPADYDDFFGEDYPITNHVHEEERQSPEADNEIIRTAVAALGGAAAYYGAVRAMPHIKRFLKEKVKPIFRPKAKGQKDQQHSVHHDLEAILVAAEEPTDSKVFSENPSTDMVIAKEQPTMSSDEVITRLFLAEAARAYSDEQLQMVINSHTIDTDDLKAIRSELMQLPRAELASIFENKARNSQMLEADLTTLLKQIHQAEAHVIDNQQLPRNCTENQLKRIDEDNS